MSYFVCKIEFRTRSKPSHTSRSGSTFESIPEQIELNTTSIYETESDSTIRRQRRQTSDKNSRATIPRKVTEADDRDRMDAKRIKHRLSQQELRASIDLRVKMDTVESKYEDARIARLSASRSASRHILSDGADEYPEGMNRSLAKAALQRTPQGYPRSISE